jgi:MFS family permease
MVLMSKSSSASSATLPGDQQDATENTPLLSGGQLAPDGSTEASGLANGPGPTTTPSSASSPSPSSSSVPLPKLQIFLLCYARVLEPIAFFSIFPFIAQMVQRNGNLPASDVGFYSGLIESLFSATQMVVLVFWGRLADRVGRKPMLIYSLVGTSVCPALFGMSRNIGQMIFFRCLAGIFSGSSLIIRTMISENSTPETQARAFSWFAFAGNVGILVGPLLGGALADPAEQYGWDLAFFRSYPYALPGFVTAAISLSGAVGISFFLKETLHRNKANPSDAAHAGADAPPPRRRLSVW